MKQTRSMLGGAFIAILAVGPLAAPASAQDRWDWNGGGADDRGAYELVGPGVAMLEPELRDTRRGHAFVMRNFDFDHNGRVSPQEARAANRAFLDAAGAERGRFDWEHRGRPDEPPRVDRGDRGDRPDRADRGGRGGWDRQGMRNYRFRQGRYGAMFTLQDVLFETGSARLRAGAAAQLEPLADYLDANPAVRVRIDGFTDSVGSEASNLTLSRNRAQAVADALATMNVEPARLQRFGHGEGSPVATNATAAGRQLNRRVEVTLIGQRASSFN
jgi:outer membrane protein OmpA-like peptidoglycan-associated protein